jgi:hypothetical protein
MERWIQYGDAAKKICSRLPDVNAPAESLEDAVIACIKADQPVFFG